MDSINESLCLNGEYINTYTTDQFLTSNRSNGKIQTTYKHKDLIISLVLTLGGIIEIVAMPPTVYLIQKVGHKAGLYVSTFVEVVDCFIAGFAVNLEMIYIGRTGQHVGVIILDITANALLATRFDGEQRASALSTGLHALPLCYITASTVGTVIYQHVGFRVVFIATGLLGLIEVLYRILMLDKEYDDTPSAPISHLSSYFALVSHKVPLAAVILKNFGFTAFFVINGSAPNDLVSRLNGEFCNLVYYVQPLRLYKCFLNF